MIKADGDAAIHRVALERGADGVMTKPINFAALKIGNPGRLTA
jgi:hypothetical protein